LNDGTTTAIETAHGAILDVWPGPALGSFAVHTAKGVGVLAGEGIALLASPPPGSILRSSRIDAVWISSPDASGERRAIHEWRANGAGRLLLRTPTPIIDFDVTEKGAIAYLTTTEVVMTDGNTVRSFAAPAGARRVFVSLDGSESAIVSSEKLCRTVLPAIDLRCDALAAGPHAIVRDAWTGSISTEPKLTAARGLQ
jgi:hypothetical protein